MSKKTLNIGMIGCGFMAKTHSNAYANVAHFFDVPYKPVLKTVCDLNVERATAFAAKWGYENIETDWHKVIADPAIDLIDICLPNNLHAPLAIAAAEAGKAVVSEKPLARNTAECEAMVAAVEKAGVPNFVSFNYRRMPAVALAKQIIDSGKLGKIFHYRANFLQDWTINANVPQGGKDTWRLNATEAGSGVTGDLLAHCIDLAIWQNGPIKDVTALAETFVKERKNAVTGKVEPVKIDDACTFICRFENGSLGNFEATRYARGHKALFTFEINGEHASIKWDLHDMHRLQFFDHSDEGIVRGWRSIHVSDGDQPYMGAWWVPGLAVGYGESFTHQFKDFLEGMASNKPAAPTFRDALITARVCDAVLESAASGQWATL